MSKITKNTLLGFVRKDRPEQTIYEVLDFALNSLGFYNVKVVMDIEVLDTVIKEARVEIAFPKSKYDNLPDSVQKLWCNL